MGRYRTSKGERLIESDRGTTWAQEGRRWKGVFRGVGCELEKRRASPGDTPDTGWYLYTNGVHGGYFGEWCGRRVLEAVDEADRLLRSTELVPYEQ
jgi:hypothetical protein